MSSSKSNGVGYEQAIKMEQGESGIGGINHSTTSRRHNTSSKMNSSVLRFKNVNFVVGKGDKAKYILQDVSGKVKYGHVLAVMGPSGAGKTTLISALTLDAYHGKPYGDVTLNGVRLNEKIFKKHAFVVKQQDKHWPYLTARETLTYAAALYEVANKQETRAIVSEIISKLGLDSCADTRCARLSGGQRRRLSLAVALLKQPTLLFLDEPTSGLDAAAASNIMQEIIRVAREERLVVLCTIHQPSTKVYNGFDEVMILSKGREAFSGGVQSATPYFDSIGYPLPPATNPAEHFLDLVNSDFSSNEEVDHILNTWEEQRPDTTASLHGKARLDRDEQEGIENTVSKSLANEILIMFRRHFFLIIRDPVLYLGRCAIFLIANVVFSLVYWNARDTTQDQVQNKLWIMLWFIAVPTQMGVVAVYALNDEFKSILGESKNGMVSAPSYILAKTVLVIPVMFIFALFALGIPGFLIQDIPMDAFLEVLLLWVSVIYVFENAAELFAVVFDDPIIGMLQFMNIWFASFLFGGFLIPFRDLFWPFKLFYYILPYPYYVRSTNYAVFTSTTWEPCIPEENPGLAVCVDSTDGTAVLDGFSRVFPLVTSENKVWTDILICLGIAIFFKICSVLAISRATRKVAKIDSGLPPRMPARPAAPVKENTKSVPPPPPQGSDASRGAPSKVFVAGQPFRPAATSVTEDEAEEVEA